VRELEKIASQAGSRGLPFLLTGGHAVITHGFPRRTFDLDLIIRRNDKEKWLELAKATDYAFLREGPAFVQFLGTKPESFPLDLMLVNEATFEKLQADAVEAPGIVPGVAVVSLMHLLALKCHAIKHGHSGRIVKDADDVIRLVQNNRLDPNSPILRQLFLKHGTEEFYEKVRATCHRD